MKTDRAWLAAMLVLVLLGLAAAWFLTHFERVREEQYVGYRGEARFNPWLAAQRLLDELDIRVEKRRSISQLDPLPGPGAVLFLPDGYVGVDSDGAQVLLDWVEAGNHLILAPRRRAGLLVDDDTPPSDPLLALAGIRAMADDGSAPPAPLARMLGMVEEDDAGGIEASLDHPSLARPLQVRLQPGLRLENDYQDDQWQLRANDAVYGLRAPWGEGSIAVLADPGLLRNDRIGQLDHAALLWFLADAGSGAGELWWVLSDDMPALPVWLARQAPAAVISATVLLLLWLWSAARRFGPRQPNPAPVRRSLREHLRASGRFLWRHGQGEALLAASRSALFERLHRVHPDWRALDEAELQARLAEHAGLPLAQVQRALNGPVGKPFEFTQQMQQLQALRNSL